MKNNFGACLIALACLMGCADAVADDRYNAKIASIRIVASSATYTYKQIFIDDPSLPLMCQRYGILISNSDNPGFAEDAFSILLYTKQLGKNQSKISYSINNYGICVLSAVEVD